MIEKNKLAELIDGYAIAKSSGNSSLVELSLEALKAAVDTLYVDRLGSEESSPITEPKEGTNE